MPELPCPVRGALDTINAADTEGFLALFEPTKGYVNDWGREFRGRDAIRRWSNSRWVGKRVKVTVIHFYATGEGEIMVIVEVAGEKFHCPCTLTFGVDGNALTSMLIFA